LPRKAPLGSSVNESKKKLGASKEPILSRAASALLLPWWRTEDFAPEETLHSLLAYIRHHRVILPLLDLTHIRL
jgi:hypothetical protein